VQALRPKERLKNQAFFADNTNTAGAIGSKSLNSF
jgi:hypothetical protein